MSAALRSPGAGFSPAPRIATIGVSEILRITAKAGALKRAGRPMIVLGAGEPDFDTPEPIKNAAIRAIGAGATKYTALDGSPELKEAVRRKFSRENGLVFTQDEVTCGAGAKQILYNAFMATLAEGDEVVIPTPYWTSYSDIVTIAGGRPVLLPCGAEAGFRLQPAQLEAAITPRTRWLLLNSPSNPSGAGYRAEDLAALAAVIRRHPQVWVMSDDMYEHIVYDGFRFATFAAVAPDLTERTLTVNGVSKAYAMTGWRIGYGGGPSALIKAMAVVQSQATSCPCSVSQAAAIAALDGPQDVVAERRMAFQRRRDLVVQGLNAVPGLDCPVPDGAFYTFASCAGLIGTRTPEGRVIGSDRDVADYLLDADVAVVPGSCFGLEPFFRISYATSDEELRVALARIAQACSALVAPVRANS
ncbi:aspartate aminotransferase [Methylobacterium tarhaniae]|uniref:Aminotransferase n=1 Tax=Methylobacterium tarhaniae TaxID=1187852 RepID=A0A0J6SCY9_9HYPH|nr:pyridoxal phosphate-dependent aminotransferase [Methylobacterium tarhaniae]KMO31597.1 aspartate aminotransferase [Methylobacterium tarhaniae]